ncbi:transmembrane protein 70 homolog, mitochondrial [Osmia bicornis bicornis]|uniref:transmembrane protein 70 homolog, mitochondrial n=1 Tax=Osmia bicornis bicornis TaxID=1437191 RepID=UPI0010F8319E|nr:transmembrane protein 70 homolog, mitochondrial [Osmia bicornis bicornis]
MALILRHCILSQKKRFVHEFLLFHRNVSSHTFNINNVKKFGSLLCAKHFSTKNDGNSDRELIYEGYLTKRIRRLKLFSFFTSAGSIISLPAIYMKAVHDDNLANMGIMFAFLNLVLTLTPLFIHLTTKRYVTEMYYYPKEDMYGANVYGLFLNKRQLKFTKDDVDVPESGGMLTSCKIQGNPLLFGEEDFKDARHYFIIMGYNDPIDFEMGTNAAGTGKIDLDLIREKLKNYEKDQKQIESKELERN